MTTPSLLCELKPGQQAVVTALDLSGGLRRRLRRFVREDNNQQVLRFLWAKTLLLTVIYPWYALFCVIAGMFRSHKW